MGCDLAFKLVDKETKEEVRFGLEAVKMRGSSDYKIHDLKTKIERCLEDIAFDNGFYTDEERAEVRTWYHNGFYFRARIDNCDTVEVFTPDTYDEKQLATAVASYIGKFVIFDWKKLNGFPGLDCIKWDIKKGRPNGH